jgi:hypothetical protein
MLLNHHDGTVNKQLQINQQLLQELNLKRYQIKEVQPYLLLKIELLFTK